MDTNRILNIFVASPGDIVIERKIVREVCLGLNESEFLRHLGITIDSVMWDDVFPSQDNPQAIVQRVIDECDILVCIFYKRFYTRSGRIESENLNKFLLSYDSWKALKKPHIMLYFRDVKAPGPSSSEENELNEVRDNILKDNILFADTYSEPYEFCEKIYDHLEKWVRDNTNIH